MEALHSLMRKANSMPNLARDQKESLKKRHKYGATADLARELRIQRRLILKMTAQMEKGKAVAAAAATVAAQTVDLPRRRSDDRRKSGDLVHGNSVRENYERQQRRQHIAQTLKRAIGTGNTTKHRRRQQPKKVKALPRAYRSLRNEAHMRVLRDQQEEVDRPRIRRQVISQSYLRRSSSSGKIKLASHHGIWQPGNPNAVSSAAEASFIARGRTNKSNTASLPKNYYTSDGSQRVDGDADVEHALSQYAYLINNRVKKKVYGKASFMSIPGMNADQVYPESTYAPETERIQQQQQQQQQQQYPNGNNPGQQQHTGSQKNPLIHPADAELKEMRRRQKKRMPVILFPDVQGWQAQVKIKPLITATTWTEHRERVRRIQPAGGGGGDKGRGKADTQIVQDLLTTGGLNYGEKLYNAAAETADREDLLKTTTFPKGWGTG